MTEAPEPERAPSAAEASPGAEAERAVRPPTEPAPVLLPAEDTTRHEATVADQAAPPEVPPAAHPGIDQINRLLDRLSRPAVLTRPKLRTYGADAVRAHLQELQEILVGFYESAAPLQDEALQQFPAFVEQLRRVREAVERQLEILSRSDDALWAQLDEYADEPVAQLHRLVTAITEEANRLKRRKLAQQARALLARLAPGSRGPKARHPGDVAQEARIHAALTRILTKFRHTGDPVPDVWDAGLAGMPKQRLQGDYPPGPAEEAYRLIAARQGYSWRAVAARLRKYRRSRS